MGVPPSLDCEQNAHNIHTVRSFVEDFVERSCMAHQSRNVTGTVSQHQMLSPDYSECWPQVIKPVHCKRLLPDWHKDNKKSFKQNCPTENARPGSLLILPLARLSLIFKAGGDRAVISQRPVILGDLLSPLVTRKYQFLHQTYMLGALDFKGLEILGAQLLFLEYGGCEKSSRGILLLW